MIPRTCLLPHTTQIYMQRGRGGKKEEGERERKIGYDWMFLAEIRVVNFWLIKLMYALQSTLHGFLMQKTNIWNMSLHFLSMKGEMYFLFVLLCLFIRNNYKSHNSNSPDNIWTNPMCFFFCFTDSLEVWLGESVGNILHVATTKSCHRLPVSFSCWNESFLMLDFQ